VKNLVTHGYASGPADATFKAFAAGVNMDMASPTYIENLPQLVRDDKITESQLDAAVLPILAIKIQLGLFDQPYADESKVEQILNRPEGLALERKLAARSMVLLRNENHTLPLKTSLKSVAVIGPLADSTRDIEGGWTVEGLFGGGGKSHPVTVLAGIKNKLGSGSNVTCVSGPRPQREYPSMIDVMLGEKPQPPPSQAEIDDALAKVKSVTANADVIVAVLGETSDMSGEGASRASLDLPGIQQQMLEIAVASGRPVVVVLESGRPLDIRWAASHVPAILESWYPGTEGGNAVADILFGDANPGGKLPVTWPRVAGQEPLFYNHNLTHDPEDAPAFTSRYWELSSTPLYPFGYGLSYTTFKFANLHLSKTNIKVGDATEAAVDVTNTGSLPGDAVAQLYIHQRFGSASRPVRELKGFERVSLQPGETRTLKFTLGRDELQFWSPQTKEWTVEPSTLDVWAGEDSTATLHTQFTVTR